jgi:hypothetical protein
MGSSLLGGALALALALLRLGRRPERVADQNACFLGSVCECLAGAGGTALPLQRLEAALLDGE